MKKTKFFTAFMAGILLALCGSCDHIDNKAVPSMLVHIDLGNYAMWNAYGVSGMGEYRIFDRDNHVPSNFPFNINTYTGYGGVLLMMGMDAPMAYDMSCPVEASPTIRLSINPDNFEAVCSRCGSRYNPLTGLGGPVAGVAINNKVGMRQYHVYPSNGGYVIAN